MQWYPLPPTLTILLATILEQIEHNSHFHFWHLTTVLHLYHLVIEFGMALEKFRK